VPLREDSRDGKGEKDTRLPKVEKRLPRVKDTFLKKSKYRHLLNDPQVNRWLRNNTGVGTNSVFWLFSEV
jgi:hypothetical protein